MLSDGIRQNRYDVESRLIRTAAPGGDVFHLSYDPLGRLLETTFGGAVTRFLYDGDRLVAEYDGANAVTARYVHGPGPDEALVWYDGAGLTGRRWLHADHQTSTVAVSTAAAAIVGAPYTYDPYGAPDAGHGFGGVRFRYTGQISLTHAPYWHYKARAYQPQIGRFLQTDPVGYEAGLNLYAYVGNDPMGRTDPTGQRDVVVLSGPIEVPGAHHQGMLIGRDGSGWFYVSKDGAEGGGMFGPSASSMASFHPDLTLADILPIVDRPGRYTEAYYHEASPSQDGAMIDIAINAATDDYNFFDCNCGDVVTDAITGAGVDSEFPNVINPADSTRYMRNSESWRSVTLKDTRSVKKQGIR